MRSLNMACIGVGAGKSGTTWLFDQIQSHPEISSKNPKEINYFSRHYKDKGLDWYVDHFDDSESYRLCEFSVEYLITPGTAERIHSTLGPVKILAVLRNPVDRLYSDFLHSIRKGDVSPDSSFEEYCLDHSRIRESKYDTLLQPYFDIFGQELVKVIIYEKMMAHPLATIKELYGWLGVSDTDFQSQTLNTRVNHARLYRNIKIENIIARTSRFLNNNGYSREVESLKRTGIIEVIRKLNTKDGSVQSLAPEERRNVFASFRSSISNLEILSGLDLQSVWG